MRKMRKLGIFIIWLGVFSLLSSGGILAYNLWDDNRAGESAAVTTQLLHKHIAAIAEAEYEGEITEDVPKLIEIDGEFYIGILRIPAFRLEFAVNNEWSDERLENTPCRYSGDLISSLVICAHNYRNHFGKLSNLSRGDKVLITDARGNEYWYNSELIEIIHETDTDVMVDSPYDLTLFTCALSRAERITVRFTKIDYENPPFPGYEIRQGQVNGNALIIQRYLNAIRNIQSDIPPLDEDGSFGEITLEAVQEFQRAYGLKDDGVVGIATWSKMVEVYNNLR